MRLCAHHAGLLAAAIGLVPLGAASAQQAPDPSAAVVVEPNLAPVGPPLSAAESEALARALVFDPTHLSGAPDKSLRVPGEPKPYSLDVSGKTNPDGSSTVNMKRPISADWNANVGADLNLAAAPTDRVQPGRLLSAGDAASSTGAAWASLGLVDNLASIDARLDGGSDQAQLGTTLQRSLPVGSRFSVTFRDRYALSDTLSATPSAPTGLPVMALPQATGPSPEQVWTNQRDVKFNILPTGTTLSAGLASASTDPVTHNVLSAEQKLYGPLHVTTSVTDLGETTVNKSITAGLKLNW